MTGTLPCMEDKGDGGEEQLLSTVKVERNKIGARYN